MRALIWLLLLGLTSCGADAALIIVSVTGRPSEVRMLSATVTLDGKKTAMPEEIEDDLVSFGLLLPPGASGPFLLEADGLDGAGCVVARGRTDTNLTGKDRVRLRLEMSKLPIPECRLAGASASR